MKKILFFTCEPGGAEVLIPVIDKMRQDVSCEVIVLSYGYAIERFSKKNIDFKVIEQIEKDNFLILEDYKPDFIITSATSLPQKDMSEKYLWYNAKQKNIPTMAFLDQWQNYAIRFSGITKDEYMTYQPDLINSINDIGKREMIKLGFKSDNLLELGQPYLTTLKHQGIDKDYIYEKLKFSKNRQVVLFVSEAIEEHFGNDRGYTQYETIEYLLKSSFVENKQVIIKLHPKDDITKFSKYKNVVLIQNEYLALEMIAIADYVIGMTSIMLIEALILDKKVLSLQLNSKEDLLLLSKEKIIKKIINKNHKINELDFIKNGSFEYKFNYLKFKEYLV